MEKLEIIESVNRFKDKIEDIIKSIVYFSDTISENNLVISNLISEIKDKLDALYDSIKLSFDVEESIKSNLNINKEQLNNVIEYLQDMLTIIKKFVELTNNTTTVLESLNRSCEGIVGLMSDLNELNERSMNTARNAEIKAYHSGEEGKGFEVVARFLGNFSYGSMEIVSSIVSSMKQIKDSSTNLIEIFQGLKGPINEIGIITENLNQHIDNMKDIFKGFDEIAYSLKNESEKEDKTKSNLVFATSSMKDISENIYLNSSRVNLVVRSKESLYEVFRNVLNIFVLTNEKGIYSDFSNTFLLNYILNFLNLFHVIDNEFKNINFENIKKAINLSIFDDLKESLNTLSFISEKIILNSQELEKSSNNLNSLLSKLREQNEMLLSFVNEATSISENLQFEFGNFRKKGKSVKNAAENLKDLSLYAKLESARAGKEDLGVIVEQMIDLSNQFKKISNDIDDFLDDAKNKVSSINFYFNEIRKYLNNLIDKSESSSSIILDTSKSLRFIEQISSDFKNNISTQRILIEDIYKRFENIFSSFDTAIFEIKNIQNKIQDGKDSIDDVRVQFSTIEVMNGKGKDTLRLYLSSDPVTLDPSRMGDSTSSRVGHLIYRGIFEFAYKTWVYPTLLEYWRISNDGRKITFRLKNNIYAHNNQEITSSDVVYSYKRTMAAPNAFFFDAVNDVKVIDKLTFEFDMKFPYVPLFSNLATIGGAIFPQNINESLDEKPIGTGPYKLVEWKKGDHILLEAFNKYIFGRPYTDRIKFLISKDETEHKTSLDYFIANLIDIASISYTQIDKVLKDEYLKKCLIREISLDFQYFGFNLLKEDLPFSDVRVRRAMSYMIDRGDMLKKLDNGYGTPAKGPIPPGVDCYNPSLKGYEYNPDKAKELLKEAGFPNGLPDTYILDISTSSANTRRAEYLINQFKKFGINLEIRSHPWKEFLRIVHQGEQQLYMLGWSSDNGDPDNFLYPLFHSKNRGESGNTSFYSNPEVDKLIEQGMRELNPKVRREIYRKAEEIIVKDAPLIFLYHGLDLYLVRDNVRGFVPNILENNKFELVWLE